MVRPILILILMTSAAPALSADDRQVPDKRPSKIWTRTGPLGDTPKHVTDACPLSDQENKGRWMKFEPMADEFNGDALDMAKWNSRIAPWKGRQPALFRDENATVSDGKLHLIMRKEKLPDKFEKLGYKDYNSAALHTKAKTGCYSVEYVRAWKKQDETKWTSLFDGQNLDGWVVKCLPQDNDRRGYWKVVDGTITAETPTNSKHNYIWLLTEEEYGDFELRMKVQTYATSTGNSGVQVRSRYDDESGWLDGPQVDINPPGPWRCGFIYDETREAKVWLWPDVGRPANAKPEHAPEGWKWSHADDQDAWNDVHIVCKGTRIKTIINGVTIADCDGAGRLDDEAHRSRNVGLKGHIGLQIHPGKELRIRFKDIEVRELD